jgi:uncharacterized protein
MRLLFIFVMLLVTSPVFAQQPTAQILPRTISTTGESIVFVVPDEAIVNFGVETFNLDLDKAKSENDERSAKLLLAIKALDIDAKYIQADTLNIEIQYRDRGHPTQGIEGYFARRMYCVNLKNIKLLEKLVDVALKNGANRLIGFDFKTSELRKHRDQARKMAIQAAKEKAIHLAGEVDMKVGKPRTIGEGYSGYSGYRGWNSQMSQNAMQAVDDGGEGGATLPLGQIAVRATISVTFDLE